MKMNFTTYDITRIAVFIAMLLMVDMVWLNPFVAVIIYGVVYGMILITAARVIGKKGTILIIGIINTIINLAFAQMYGGTLAAFAYLAGAMVLEGMLQLSRPYCENRNIAVIGTLAYGLVSRSFYVLIIIFVYNLVLPTWLTMGAIASFAVTFPIGGLLGYKLGKRLKNVSESM
ncbi:hypothetical protein [Methanobacterium petrolearium]|uniref:hypothetical protein n=1 Tax=Methanobacterium petrolearium TaxID=710190 RepID=UPI001AE8A784|nr:hypothetical protein [Methanobacterium petrolearium]MBP1946010.1 hypothetical protein [Methanobacterium petrolearium]BDZ70863.1 hypothetical protein GCM10025861_13800 [Methanobacterium petrolearium]